MSSQSLVTVVLGVVEIVSFSIMSRLLSQQDFGYFAAVSAITIVFASFSETGIGAAIIQRKEIDSRFINNSFTISFVFGIFLTLLLIALAKPLSYVVADSTLSVPLLLMSVTLLCNCLSSVNISIMYRRLEFLHVGVINLISLVITSIVAIVLAYYGFGFYSIIVKSVLTSIITFLLSLRLAKTKFRFQFDIQTFKSVFGFSGWLMASVFFRNFAQQIDKLLMSRLLSVESLGAYNRPKEFIVNIANKFGNIYDIALFPVLSQIQDSIDSIRQSYLKSRYLLNLTSVVLAFGLISNGSLIIRFFFGSDWLNLLSIFQILSLSLIFSFDARLADCYLRSLGQTKQQFYFRIVEVTLKLLGILIGAIWGIIGVSILVLLSDMIMVIIKNLYLSKGMNISVIECFNPIFRSCKVLLILLPIYILCYMFMPKVILYEVIYAVIFALALLISFLLLPSMVGYEYKSVIYPKIIQVIKKH